MLIEKGNVPVVKRATGAAQGITIRRLCQQRLASPNKPLSLPPSRTYEVWIGGDRDRAANDGYLWMTRLAAFVNHWDHGGDPRR
jgi:hypothetical protein